MPTTGLGAFGVTLQGANGRKMGHIGTHTTLPILTDRSEIWARTVYELRGQARWSPLAAGRASAIPGSRDIRASLPSTLRLAPTRLLRCRRLPGGFPSLSLGAHSFQIRPNAKHTKKDRRDAPVILCVSGWADLNRRPLGPEPSALAPALQPVKNKTPLARGFSGATGIEPAISGLTGRRDNQLRHAPLGLTAL